jgi:hypothetical protein
MTVENANARNDYSPSHIGSFNALFCDEHVTVITAADLGNLSLHVGRGCRLELVLAKACQTHYSLPGHRSRNTISRSCLTGSSGIPPGVDARTPCVQANIGVSENRA